MTIEGLRCQNQGCESFGEELSEVWSIRELVKAFCVSCDYVVYPDEVDPAPKEDYQALREAADRARLLLHTLDARMDGCHGPAEASRLLQEVLYEAEATLHYALFGIEPRSEASEEVSVAFPEVSGRSEGVSERSENGSQEG